MSVPPSPRRRLSDLSIRSKLFLTYFALVLFFLFLSLGLSSVLVMRQNRVQVLRSAGHVFGQTRAYIQYKIESVRTLLYFLTSSGAIQELFERRPEYYRDEIGRWPIDAQTFEKLSYVTEFSPDILRTVYYMKYGLASVFQNDTYLPLGAAEEELWYRRIPSSDRRVHWYVDQDRALHAVRSVQDTQNVLETTGLIRFDLAEDMVRSPLGDALLTESTSAWLVNESGDLIAAAGPLSAEGARSLHTTTLTRRGADFLAEHWSGATLDRSGYTVGSQGIDGTDWMLYLALPDRDLVRMSARPAQFMLLALLVVTPLALGLAFLVSGSATRRIDLLISRMDHVAVGDFTVRLDPGNTDEIGRLTDRFNSMVMEIGQLMEEKYRLGKEVKNLELKALQAQINPHFLYNTLDLINWMSLRRGATEIGELVGALSRFYKLSLGKGEDTAGLGEELEHVRTYVRIQNMRYESAIRLQIEVPEALLGCRVPRLIIQPLVENAIFHGIMMKPEERGTVCIRCQIRDGYAILTVDDDGVGMSAEVARAILTQGHSPSEHHGYGVRNIHERLELAYGTGCGLSFGTLPGGGTRVTIRMPTCSSGVPYEPHP